MKVDIQTDFPLAQSREQMVGNVYPVRGGFGARSFGRTERVGLARGSADGRAAGEQGDEACADQREEGAVETFHVYLSVVDDCPNWESGRTIAPKVGAATNSLGGCFPPHREAAPAVAAVPLLARELHAAGERPVGPALRAVLGGARRLRLLGSPGVCTRRGHTRSASSGGW